MNIFVDENIPQQIVALLRAEGHKVEYVTRQIEDRIILDHAYQQQALLLRVSRTIPIKDRARILANVLQHRQNELHASFTTLTEAIIVIRRPLP
ncbi:MAG: DUF5615 family PIN-like protein [Ktedonobacteraceae bacterium]